jgi:hypothetical protein
VELQAENEKNIKKINTFKPMLTMRSVHDNLSTSMEIQQKNTSLRRSRNTVIGSFFETDENGVEEVKTGRRMTQIPRLSINNSFFDKANTIKD